MSGKQMDSLVKELVSLQSKLTEIPLEDRGLVLKKYCKWLWNLTYLQKDATEAARKVSECEKELDICFNKVQAILKKAEQAKDKLLNYKKFLSLEKKIGQFEIDPNIWEHAYMLGDLIYEYSEQLEVMEDLEKVEVLHKEVEGAWNYLKNVPKEDSAAKEKWLSKIKTQCDSLQVVIVGVPSIIKKLPQVVIEEQCDSPQVVIEKVPSIASRLEEVKNMKKGLTSAGENLDASAVSILRFLSDQSEVEPATIFLFAMALAGTVHNIPFYMVLGIHVWDYWVLQDYIDNGIRFIPVLIIVVVITGILAKNAHLKLFRGLESEDRPKLVGISRLAHEKPMRVLLIGLSFAFLIMLICGVSRGFSMRNALICKSSENCRNLETAITTQDDILQDVILVGTTARVAFFLVKPRSQSFKPRTIFFRDFPLKILAIDRAQIICHSSGDECKEWVGLSPTERRVEVVGYFVNNSKRVASLDLVSFIKTFLHCNLYPDEQPLASVYFNRNKYEEMCEDHWENGRQDCLPRWAHANIPEREFKLDDYLLVLGHASNTGSLFKNLELGEKRAEAVAKELKKGREEGRNLPQVSVETLGDLFGGRSRDLEINDDRDPDERRVDIYVCQR
ncbi:MAG: hypothetical protein GQ581_04140 [Methyloprofundus sp.]|nr:hypothetical protein [Methyloprofundus sp.]